MYSPIPLSKLYIICIYNCRLKLQEEGRNIRRNLNKKFLFLLPSFFNHFKGKGRSNDASFIYENIELVLGLGLYYYKKK